MYLVHLGVEYNIHLSSNWSLSTNTVHDNTFAAISVASQGSTAISVASQAAAAISEGSQARLDMNEEMHDICQAI